MNSNDKRLMEAYCPICDEEMTVFSASTIFHCPKCGHHLNLHPAIVDNEEGSMFCSCYEINGGLTMQETIFLITVFDKCEPDPRWGYNLGDTRSVGWRPTFEMAEEAVKSNMCDIWETCYDYACIEELDYGLYPWARERWFYKYNEETGKYDEIDEPVILKDRGPIGGIG